MKLAAKSVSPYYENYNKLLQLDERHYCRRVALKMNNDNNVVAL